MSQLLCCMRLKLGLDQSLNSTLEGAQTVVGSNMSKSSGHATNEDSIELLSSFNSKVS